MMSEVGHKLNAMHDTDIDDHDGAWRKDRRRLLEQYYNIVRKHELDRDARELAFARAALQVLRKANDVVCEAAVVADFTTTALHRLRESENAAASSQGHASASAAGPQHDVSAHEKYLNFFVKDTDGQPRMVPGVFRLRSPR